MKALHGFAGDSNSFTNGTTFVPLGTYPNGYAAETDAQIIYRTAGVLSNLYINSTFNNCSGACTFTLSKNTVVQTSTISVPASSTGQFTDTTHSDTVAAGDKIAIKLVVVDSGAGDIELDSMTMLFLPSDGITTSSKQVFGFIGSTQTGANTDYYQISGYDQSTTQITEANGKGRMRKAGTMKSLAVNIGINTCNTASTFIARKNAADGTLTVSVPSTSTGFFEDTTHSDSVAAGDDYYHKVTIGGTAAQALTIRSIELDFENTSDIGMLCNAFIPPAARTTNKTFAIGIVGGGSPIAITSVIEAAQCIPIPINYTSFSELTAWIQANTITTASTIKLRKNFTNGNLGVSIPASGTGVFSDSSNSDRVAATDLLDYMLITGGTGTSLTLQSMGIWYTQLPNIAMFFLSDGGSPVIFGPGATASFNPHP